MAESLPAPALVTDDHLAPWAPDGQRDPGSAVPGVLPRSVVDPKAAHGRFEVPVPPGPQPPSEPPSPDQPPPDPRVALARRLRPVEV